MERNTGKSQSFFTEGPLEPLFFSPLLMPKLWGGHKLAPLFGVDESTAEPYGEAWLVSGYEGEETPVREGAFEGETLSSLLLVYGTRLLGYKNFERFGHRFPLLIKFIDAAQDLSIQVHPTDEVAHQLGLPSGKTEMWYVLDAAQNASLRIGFNRNLSAEELEMRIHDSSLCDVLATHSIRPGNCFLIPAGRIHSIGAGAFLLEIQQSSDATFRVYDFNRRDAQGRQRQLHIHEAKTALDLTAHDDYQTRYTPAPDRAVTLEQTPFFTTRHYSLTRPMCLDLSADRFVVLVATEGRATLCQGEKRFGMRRGDAVLLPAELDGVTLIPAGRNFKFVETFVE